MSESSNVEKEQVPIVELDGEEEDDGICERSRLYKCRTRFHLKWLADIPKTWPRTYSLFVGVIIPLWVLIFFSLIFGYGIASLEAPAEIDSNDAWIAATEKFIKQKDFLTNLTAQLPKICLYLYFNATARNEWINITVELEEELAVLMDRVFAGNLSIFSQELELPMDENTLNATELSVFVMDCNSAGAEVIGNVTEDAFSASQQQGSGTLTFNWIRCSGVSKNTAKNKNNLLPSQQQQYVIEKWKESEIEWHDYFLEKFSENMTTIEARFKARELSHELATGFNDCQVNFPGGAWFWFTVMSTIGYGNVAPESSGGRWMVFTLGFVSILAFGGVLAHAGNVVVTIFDDGTRRLNLRYLQIPWVACLFFAAVYYGWMAIIALYAQTWKLRRMEEKLEFDSAYWFAYISVTTVGLGDYYYDDEVMLVADIILLPFLFLIGFVLLATFVVKLTETLSGLFPQRGPTLEEKLADTSLRPDTSALHPEPNASDSCGDETIKETREGSKDASTKRSTIELIE